MWDLSSPTRDRTHDPCIERQSLNTWTTREVPLGLNLNLKQNVRNGMPWMVQDCVHYWLYLCCVNVCFLTLL